MIFVVVDNNKSDLDLLAKAIASAAPECQTQTFTDPLLSAKYICSNAVDAAFLTAEMCPVDGFILMRTLRANQPRLPIVIVSSSELNRIAAIHANANGHLQKPVSEDRIRVLVKQLAV